MQTLEKSISDTVKCESGIGITTFETRVRDALLSVLEKLVNCTQIRIESLRLAVVPKLRQVICRSVKKTLTWKNTLIRGFGPTFVRRIFSTEVFS